MTKRKPLIGDGRCTARSKSRLREDPDGDPRCKNPAMPAQNVCRYHGGLSPNSLKAAEDRIVAEIARSQLEHEIENAAAIDDPLQALMDLSAEAWAAKEFFRRKIDDLRYEAHTGEQLRSEVALYERAMDRCMKILGEIARLGIAERRAKIQEAQAVLIVRAFQRVLDALELDDQQRVIATRVVPLELRALEAAEGGVVRPESYQVDG